VVSECELSSKATEIKVTRDLVYLNRLTPHLTMTWHLYTPSKHLNGTHGWSSTERYSYASCIYDAEQVDALH
jgi:hypothetical protein